MENSIFSLKGKKWIMGVGIAVILILLISLGALLWRDYLRGIETVGINNLPAGIPSELSDSLEEKMRGLLDNNFEVPDNAMISASVRDGSYNKDEGDGVISVSFLVDIDDYQQTYEVMLGWSDTKVVPDPILISCPSQKLMKYPEANCVAMYNDSQDVKNVEDNPIYQELPIIVDYFDYYSRKGIRYEVRGYFNEENELVLTVVDYSGENLENAKQKVRDLGYNPDDYKIKYVDQSGDF